MILTPIRRYGAMILMLLTLVFRVSVSEDAHNNSESKVPLN